MPALNRAVRNAVYDLLLRTPTLGWRLSKMPRAYLTVAAETGEFLQLPRPVG
jgi:hypothetical protein